MKRPVVRAAASIPAADDVLFIPAGAPHFYEVLEAPFEFLCLVPNAPDRIELLARP